MSGYSCVGFRDSYFEMLNCCDKLSYRSNHLKCGIVTAEPGGKLFTFSTEQRRVS